jgi:hypothetical protein
MVTNQVLNIHGFHDDRQMDKHMAETLIPEPSLVEVEITIHKYPANDQIQTELIKAGGEILCSEVHRLIYSIWNKEELPQQWKESIIVPIPRINCLQNFIQHSSSQINSMYQ